VLGIGRLGLGVGGLKEDRLDQIKHYFMLEQIILEGITEILVLIQATNFLLNIGLGHLLAQQWFSVIRHLGII